jgi:hypothetical protein
MSLRVGVILDRLTDLRPENLRDEEDRCDRALQAWRMQSSQIRPA